MGLALYWIWIIMQCFTYAPNHFWLPMNVANSIKPMNVADDHNLGFASRDNSLSLLDCKIKCNVPNSNLFDTLLLLLIIEKLLSCMSLKMNKATQKKP